MNRPDAAAAAVLAIAMGGCPPYMEITAHGRVVPVWAVPVLPVALERDNREEFPPIMPQHTSKGRWPSGFP